MPLSNGIPAHVFIPGWFGIRSDEIALGKERIVLSDFGADRVTAEQVEVLGILPAEWWKNWHKRLEWFNDEGELDGTSRGHDSVRRTWDMRFDYSIQKPRAEAGLEIVTERERKAFEAMLRPMLTFRPGERATAQQALHSGWMKGWGQPADRKRHV